MNRFMNLLIIMLFGGASTACVPDRTPPTQKQIQAKRARKAARSVKFTGNAEVDNLKKRLELTSDPGLQGYITLFSQSGAPIAYHVVKGKVSSGSKRLTSTMRVVTPDYASDGHLVVPAPGDEGTYGSSSPYIYFWTASGNYVQWTGEYIYTTYPQRLRIEPVLLAITPAAASKSND